MSVVISVCFECKPMLGNLEGHLHGLIKAIVSSPKFCGILSAR